LACRRDGRVLLRGLRRAAFRSLRSVIALHHGRAPETAFFSSRLASISMQGHPEYNVAQPYQRTARTSVQYGSHEQEEPDE
jgi:hypothetical protein